MVEEFMRQMSAVLAANMLTVVFVYSLLTYTRREQAGLEKAPGGGKYLSNMLFVFAFLIGGMFFWGFFDNWTIFSGLAATDGQ